MGFLDKYLTQPKPAGVKELPAGISTATAGDPQAARYAAGALRHAADNVAWAPPGQRNHTLNAEAWSIGQLVEAGHLDGNQVLQELWQAGLACGLPEAEVASVIPRAMGQAEAREVHLDPEFGKVDAPNAGWKPQPPPPSDEEEPTSTKPSPPETVPSEEEQQRQAQEIRFQQQVRQERERLEIQAEAKRQFARASTAELINRLQPPTPLADFLSVVDPPITWVLEGLQPVGTRALLAAQAKAGKTTLVSNLIKALADGEQFLGKFFNHFTGTITLIDDELDDRMLRRWLKRLEIQHPEKIRVVTLRGRLTDFNIVDDEIRHVWADMLTGTDYLILDCLRPVLDACGLDENHEAGIFLNAYDALLKEAEIDSSLVVHHMGHGANRSRGDSRIMDWPDALWKLKRVDPDTPESKRFFSAFGREVNVPEEPLHHSNGVLVLNNDDGTRREKYASTPEEWVVQTLFLDSGNVAQAASWLEDNKRKEDREKGAKYVPSRDKIREAIRKLAGEGALITEITFGGKGYRLNLESKKVAAMAVSG